MMEVGDEGGERGGGDQGWSKRESRRSARRQGRRIAPNRAIWARREARSKAPNRRIADSRYTLDSRRRRRSGDGHGQPWVRTQSRRRPSRGFDGKGRDTTRDRQGSVAPAIAPPSLLSESRARGARERERGPGSVRRPRPGRSTRLSRRLGCCNLKSYRGGALSARPGGGLRSPVSSRLTGPFKPSKPDACRAHRDVARLPLPRALSQRLPRPCIVGL